MPARETPSKSAGATATPVPLDDLSHGERDPEIEGPSGSSSNRTLDRRGPSITSTPTLRQSLDFEDPAPPYEARAQPFWKRAGRRLPAPIVRSGKKTGNWFRGPVPSRRYRIKPFNEYVQTAPRDFVHRLRGWWRYVLFGAACFAWALTFGLLLSLHGLPDDVDGHGPPVRLSCVDTLWSSAEACGLDGRNCQPFTNASFPFYCPSNCASAKILNPRAVGDQSYNYQPLVIGGHATLGALPTSWTYRGDSFICGAAIHFGLGVTNKKGGCGLLQMEGEQIVFGSSARNGIISIPFFGKFPMSFIFRYVDGCEDPRWKLLILSIIMTVVFGCFTSSPATFFAPIFTIMFFQVAMASDPPGYSMYAGLASTALGRFLPAALVAVFIYRTSVHRALKGCNAHLEKTVLWVGGAWVGALSNYTFDKIPIQRLTGHDIRQQPGAIAALVIIVLVLFIIVLYQCWCLRIEGRLPRYLAIYACLGISLGILAAMPKLNLRIHHYILALLLLPGTAMQTRLSLLCQGLLVGLFINGIARWGFDSILQTSVALRGDAQLGSDLPKILEPVINGTSITFTWEKALQGWDGISVLVNDVQRYIGNGGEEEAGVFTWENSTTLQWQSNYYEDVETFTYFRFGFFKYLPFGQMAYGDYTRAGTWFKNGTWSGIPPGRT
ncbi:LCCL domain-containing protein [Plenodomus tracheiphilus IPT5]|uniref:LCCL domain-containing protein n=1 Tax=Plenodomus tracheiphilus IPT5 TaxID=1408161 RepID=A0A6A7BH84_9PLEO|nr:LCCL domain-containing protein [Plenodomus tracheiphilus IPT5]